MRSHSLQLQVSVPEPRALTERDSDIFWCKDLCEEAFLFTLDNAPYILCEVAQGGLHNTGTATSPLVPDALFILNTLTCYETPVAEWLSGALASHYRFSASLSMQIRIALHEAIANAVMHGNLAIQKPFYNKDGFETYCRLVRYRLSEPEFGFARITIAVMRSPKKITLRISDEGSGYPGCSYNQSDALPHGLSLIRETSSALRIEDGGRTIEMDFAV